MLQKSENADFIKKFMTLVFPIAFQQFMLALVSASDALMLGALEQDKLSAVSLAGQVAFVENLFLAAMTIGLSMLAAQYWGKGDRRSVEIVFGYVVRLTVIVSFLFFAAGLCFPYSIMHIFTNDPKLMDCGAVYLRTVSVSFLLTGISQICLCILKNSAQAAKSSLISSVSVVVNIGLNAVFIFGIFGFPALKERGAALATVLAKLLEVIWCMAETAKKDSIQLRWSDMIHTDDRLRADFWTYTTPVLCNEIVWGLAFAMYSVIMGHLGSDAVAANSIANIVKNLVSCFSIGLGSGVMLVLLLPLILTVTDLSVQAQSYLRWMIVMCSYYMIGKAVNGTTISGIFCAGGDSKFGLRCDIITMWGIIVPLGCLAAFVCRLPVLAVYFILNLDEWVKLPAVYRHYKKYQWVKDLTI